MHGPSHHGAHEHPQEAREEAELAGEHGAYQRSGAGDGGEVVTEEHPLGYGEVVLPVVEAARWGGDAIVEREHPGRHKSEVEAVGEGEDGQGGNNQRHCVHSPAV